MFFYNNAGYVKSNFLDIERDGAFEIFHGKSDECNVHCHAAHRTREEAEVSAGARHAYGTINCGAIA